MSKYSLILDFKIPIIPAFKAHVMYTDTSEMRISIMTSLFMCLERSSPRISTNALNPTQK